MEIREQQTKLANNFGKLLRDKFSKGPQAIHVTICPPYVIYLSGFVSATEQVLLEQEQDITVKTTREYVMKSLEPEIRGQIKAITDLDIQQIYYDWNLANQTGVIVGVSYETPAPSEAYRGKEEVHKEIIRISEEAEKVPDHVESYRLSNRSLVVIREGILVPIEKQLVALGFDEKLRVAKRQLEGEMLLNSTQFSRILDATVQDVFVDWDFARDNSVISFVLKPNN
ncbi:Na-translocating system protein MpsC family protein [Halobacillus sp. Marseille-Q1614]|uniref:Na-translocating system protein MpsC family protein n=1 Tax=Halobacillus sp. Marseille-Q1614 TaxID=2709134 RepID=UPI00156E309F|nr:Na-translocating system protein MpsC family protein [Halobacillus sp. Marseille-Q1614]